MNHDSSKPCALDVVLHSLRTNDVDDNVNALASRNFEDLRCPLWRLMIVDEMGCTELAGDFKLLI